MAQPATNTTASADEVARFEAIAEAWWDPEGDFKPLHLLNPPRLSFLVEKLAAHFGRNPTDPCPFSGLSLLDIGCGGGLLSEPMARLGFAVTGIDAGAKNIAIARLHAAQSGLTIDFRSLMPEDLTGQFDVVMAMEVVEHVPDVSVFLNAAAERLRPGGAFLAATLNRTPKAFALAIVGAEYLLRWLPPGTHDWRHFLRPSEFAAKLRKAGVNSLAFEGVRFDPLQDRWERCRSLDVNYLVYGAKL
ncbi:MAG TPA: bifunctional 2-polyprenyl-6-hydroxyphenol methylase/3-demethylubiquinol 3-O-methyltransferase UbiG [Rhodospirillaceae bacterium]|nr:bifunctional 2-polyprenyl-6-hydroxyphenol methylase/3-demethylubiquinol 3-O-methyltransferase UbiG [Rhodospirillaceae bacterium]